VVFELQKAIPGIGDKGDLVISDDHRRTSTVAASVVEINGVWECGYYRDARPLVAVVGRSGIRQIE
jgi:hypothetical protein